MFTIHDMYVLHAMGGSDDELVELSKEPFWKDEDKFVEEVMRIRLSTNTILKLSAEYKSRKAMTGGYAM